MSVDRFFLMANTVALCGWVLLVLSVVVKNVWLRDVVVGWCWPVGLATLYAAVFGMVVGRVEGGFDTLANVKKLFASDWVLVGGWIHYLCFDLFVGAWIAKLVMDKGWTRFWLVLLLPFTFLFGPIGLLAYAILVGVRQTSNLPSQVDSNVPPRSR